MSGIATSAAQGVVGSALGQSPVPLVSAGVEIANSLKQVENAKMQPPQSYGNTNNGDVITSSYSNTFHFYDMTIQKEYSEIIDNYFDAYGYKVNNFKTPNKAHRSRWWYTKTIGANIGGSIPTNELEKIKNCYDNGITFWRNASEISRYDLSNEIV